MTENNNNKKNENRENLKLAVVSLSSGQIFVGIVDTDDEQNDRFFKLIKPCELISLGGGSEEYSGEDYDDFMLMPMDWASKSGIIVIYRQSVSFISFDPEDIIASNYDQLQSTGHHSPTKEPSELYPRPS